VSDEPRFYDVLMDLSRRAFERRQVEVAFHALSAAAHAAEDDGRMDDLEEVEQTARERLRWLDANHPKHRFSTESARLRGHQSIFDQLAVTAGGMRMRIKTDRQREAARARNRAES
jgi:hypothetical protein